MKLKSVSRMGLTTRLPRRHSLIVIGVLIALALPHADLAEAANSDARIVLHAQPYSAGNTCSTPQQSLGLNCDSVRPTVSVSPGQAVEIYVYFHSYDSLAGAQMAFTWPASWSLFYWTGACRAHEVTAVATPQASGDSYIGAFDPITGGQLQPLGRFRFVAGSSGTQFTVTETWAPGGTGVIDSQQSFSAIPVINRGIVAAGIPGVDSCGGESSSKAFY